MANKRRRTALRDGPHPTDLHVGSRVRNRRGVLGLSQEQLGDRLGITFQQVQKYERGANRISASRLWEIGRVLDAPIEWFFEGVGGIESEALGAASKRETLQLAHYFAACPPLVRKRALGLLKATADAIRDARTRAPS